MENGLDLKLPDDSFTKRFSQLSEKAAQEISANLYVCLFKELTTPPPIEFAGLLYQRLCYEIFIFTLRVEAYRKSFPGIENVFDGFNGADTRAVTPIYTPIVDMVYRTFKNELEDYKKKHKEDLGQTLAKAKALDRKAVLKLVKWDKTWLTYKFVQKLIVHAQFNNDGTFFENLSDAIRKKSGVKKKSKEENIMETVRFFAKMYDLNKDKGFKKLHDGLTDGNIASLDEDSNLHDFKYFMKQLRRHRIA